MRLSLHVKLVLIYLLILVVFIGVLGATLTSSYRGELTIMRENDIVDCAGEIAKMFADGTLSVQVLKNGMNIPVMTTTAKDFDAYLQVVNVESRRVFYEVDKDSMAVSSSIRLIEDEIYDKVYTQNQVFVRRGYNSFYKANMITVAYPIRSLNSPESERPWAILIINSDLANIDNTYNSIVTSLILPAVLIILGGLILIFFLTSRLISPIKKMNNATTQIARGEFEKRITVRSKDEIGDLAGAFNTMAGELEKSDVAKRDFIANITHELRSPMTSINGFVQGMLDGTIPPEESEKYLKIVLSETKRLNKLIQEMLNLSKMESGDFQLNKTAFDINELLRRVVIRLGQKIEEKNIIPQIEIDSGKLMVWADADRIEQVIQNLVDNAIKFTPDGKKLIIKSWRQKNKIFVSIKDEGMGISTENLKFVWDRFFTVNKARTGHVSGTGLGLPIVKRIIEQHGETITLKSTENVGTEFVFSLDAFVR